MMFVASDYAKVTMERMAVCRLRAFNVKLVLNLDFCQMQMH